MVAPVKTKVVYFRCVEGKGWPYDQLISWYSRSRYTHAEFNWPMDVQIPPSYLGAQGTGGVQIRPYDYLSWPFTTFGVKVTMAQFLAMQTFLKSQIGRPYDWKAIAAMGLSWLRGPVTTDRWFCSELVAYAFRSTGTAILRVPASRSDVLTPRDLAISTVAKIF